MSALAFFGAVYLAQAVLFYRATRRKVPERNYLGRVLVAGILSAFCLLLGWGLFALVLFLFAR